MARGGGPAPRGDRGRDPYDEIEAGVQEARKRLEAITAEFRGAGHPVTVRVHVGDPVHENLPVASEENVTLIAIGTVGKNWFREILVGSTTPGVVRNGRHPVLVLRNHREG